MLDVLFSMLKGEITQDEYLNYNNTVIIKKEFPRRIYGLIFDYQNRYFIVINKYISYYKQKKTILHELAHMELCHLDKKRLLEFKIEGLEDEADEYVKQLLEGIK
jgi:Zn-dependent peptidase ImmA (M78 family)